MKTYDTIWKTVTRQWDGYKTGCFLDSNYFKECYNVIAIDLSKQQELDSDPKAIQQRNFTGNLHRAEGATAFFIIEEAKKHF